MDAVTAAKNRIDHALAQLERKVLEIQAKAAIVPEAVDADLFAPLPSEADQARIAELETAGREAANALARAAEAVREVLAETQVTLDTEEAN